ncbi:hypothetical protein D3C85_1177890 [compost metagenome]
MFDLGLDLRQALADHVEHFAALGQLPLQAQHRQGVAQGFALQGVGVALQGADQGAVAVAQVQVVTAEHLEGVLGVADQQAAEHAAQARFADLAGLGDTVDQYGSLEHAAQCDQLLLQRIHVLDSLLRHGSATSITPPPRQTSPS